MATTAFKDQAHKLIDRLPETADWDEFIYQAVVCKEIEAGLADSAAGRVTPAEDVLRESGWLSEGRLDRPRQGAVEEDPRRNRR